MSLKSTKVGGTMLVGVGIPLDALSGRFPSNQTVGARDKNCPITNSKKGPKITLNAVFTYSRLDWSVKSILILINRGR